MTDLIRRDDALEACIDYGLSRASECRDVIAALPAVTVGVKPLVWRDAKFSDKWERWTADTIIGQYEILEYTNGTFGWNICFYDPDLGALQYSAKSLEAAKSAAQADYTARILAALEPASPDPAAIREASPNRAYRVGYVAGRAAALREAEKALRDWQASLNVHRMPETAVTVGIAADVVADLIVKGAAE